MCRIFKVSRSGFYAWCSAVKSKRSMENERLLQAIQSSRQASRETYGYRRVHKDLEAQGILAGKNRIQRLMQAKGMRAKMKRKFKVTTNSNHQQPIHDNLLNRDFNALAPNERWVSDITYIHTKEGWLYLAVIMDLYSRKIIGWSMDTRMQESLTLEVLRMALFKRKIHHGLLLHSDRGSQYASFSYQKVLYDNHIICSMSRKGNCWDNAAMESFFHTLKTEFIHFENFQTRQEAKTKIFEYIEVFYNGQRRHSAIDYCSPNEFEQRQAC
jgi:transposase InsO family protein